MITNKSQYLECPKCEMKGVQFTKKKDYHCRYCDMLWPNREAYAKDVEKFKEE